MDCGEERVNWTEAVQAMQNGAHVRRKSKTPRQLVSTDGESVPVYFCGAEACYLMHAWTDKGIGVQVFMGSGSKQPFIPESDDVVANDWTEVDGGTMLLEGDRP